MKKDMTPKYCLLQAGYWTLAAVAMAYTTPILEGKGFSGTEIGILSAIKYGAVIFFQMILGSFSDRHAKTFPLKYLIVLLILISMGFAGLFWFTGHNMAIAVLVFIVFGATVHCASPLVDSLSIQYMNQGYKLNYTISRGFGSIAWAIFCVVVGLISDAFGSNQILLFQLLMSLVFIATALIMDRIDYSEEGSAEENVDCASDRKIDERSNKSPNMKQERSKSEDDTVHTTWYLLAHFPKYVLFLIAIMLVFMGYNMSAMFLVDRIEELGGTHTDYGVAQFVLAMVEVPVAFWFYWFRRRFKLDTMMLFCAIFCALRAAASAFAPSVGFLIAAQGLELFGLSIYYAGTVFFVMDHLPAADCVKGTSLINLAGMGLGEMLGSLIGGHLRDAFGLQFLMNVSVLVSIAGIAVMYLMRATSDTKSDLLLT